MRGHSDRGTRSLVARESAGSRKSSGSRLPRAGADASSSRSGAAWRRPAALGSPSSAGSGPATAWTRRPASSFVARRCRASSRLRDCERESEALARTIGPTRSSKRARWRGPSVSGRVDVEGHLNPAERAVGVLTTGTARRGGPPRDLRERQVKAPVHVQRLFAGHGTSVRAPGYAPWPWTTDTSDAQACSSPRSPTATGSPTGSQVENDIATACVKAALENGITTFDTADVYANTAAETAGVRHSRRSAVSRSRSSRRCTGRPGPRGRTIPGTLAQAHPRVHRRLSHQVAHRLCGPLPGSSFRQARRSKRRCRLSPTSSARAKRSTSA